MSNVVALVKPGPQKMRLTVRRAVALYSALKAIEGGFDRVLKAKGEREQTVKANYKLDGKVLKKIARNIIRLQGEVDAYQSVTRNKFREISGGRDSLDPENADDAKLLAEFNRCDEEHQREETEELALYTLSEDELGISDSAKNKNTIPNLSDLDPIMVWADEVKAESAKEDDEDDDE